MKRTMRWLAIAMLLFSVRAFAQALQILQPENDEPASATTATPEAADREPAQAPTAPHMYIGARDEQKLEIQTSLPQPARTLDGNVNLSSGDDEEETPATAPTSD